MTTEYAGMDDAALEATLTADDGDTFTGDDGSDQGEAVTTPAGEEPATDEQQGGEDWNPEGPGDLKKAVDAERAEKRLYRERAEAEALRAQQYEAELARYRQAEQQAEQQRAQQEIQATYETLVNEGREDEAVAYLHRVQQFTTQQVQQQADQRVAVDKLTMSAEMAREVYPDFTDRIQMLYAEMGPDWVDARAASQPNPAKWAYEYSKAKFKTDADLDALLDARQAQRQAALQDKHKPPTRGHQTIAHVSSGTQSPAPDRKPARRMTDKELQDSLYS